MDFNVLTVILFISVTLNASLPMLCPESIPTVSIVSRCPANITEWVSAAERKSCGELRKIQNCTKADDFVYHCILNKEATLLLEVCAPRFFLAGYCARFSEVKKRIINDPRLDCTKFDPPCPARFPSNESYMYQMCYRNTSVSQQGKEPFFSKHDSTYFILYAALTIAGLIILILLTILSLGLKLNWIKCMCGKSSKKQKGQMIDNTDTEDLLHKSVEQNNENDTEKKQIDIDQKNDIEEKKIIQFRSLSGSTETGCSLKDVRTISDLRNALSVKLHIARTFISVVDKESGIIFKDDTVIDTLKRTPTELMIGNQKRTKYIDDDEDVSVENDVILNRRITSGKCRMSCGHFTSPDSLYEWTKEKLPCGSDKGLLCPRCRLWRWEIDELIEKCKMSQDETIFFKQVASLNERTAEQLGKALQKQKLISKSLSWLDDEHYA